MTDCNMQCAIETKNVKRLSTYCTARLKAICQFFNIPMKMGSCWTGMATVPNTLALYYPPRSSRRGRWTYMLLTTPQYVFTLLKCSKVLEYLGVTRLPPIYLPSSIKFSIGSSTKGQNSACARHQWPALHIHPCLYVYIFGLLT